MSDTTFPECEKFTDHRKAICRCERADLTQRQMDEYRVSWGFEPIGEWTVDMPSRGFGDTIAKFTHATGIAAVVDVVSTAVGVPCGCNQRQETLNNLLPYGGQ